MTTAEKIERLTRTVTLCPKYLAIRQEFGPNSRQLLNYLQAQAAKMIG